MSRFHFMLLRLAILAALSACAGAPPSVSPATTGRADVQPALTRPSTPVPLPAVSSPAAGSPLGPGIPLAPEAPPAPSSPEIPLAPAAPVSQNAAVVALLDDAQTAKNAGRYDSAAATVERALRIEPRNPALWQRLARIRFEEGNFPQAESLAARSNAWAGGNRALRAENWRLIAESRNRRGDEKGARAALDQAARYER